jgi:uncharacterized protein
VTVSGRVIADLLVSTSGTDSDWIVKLVDVYPDNAPDNARVTPPVAMSAYQFPVRMEVMRGKFRNSLTHPAPFVPNRPTQVKIAMQDVCHTFRKGHRIMVHVQSSWFPLIDRNPQQYLNIYKARDEDFQTATQRLFHSSRLELPVLP